MSKDLDAARSLANAGEHKKAVQKLWVVEANARTDLAEATALLELATRLSQLTTGRARNHAQLLVGHAESHINRLTAPRPTLRRSRVSCVALGGFGWDITVGRPYELDFDERAVTIHEPTTGETTTTVAYTELLAFEIGGPGARTPAAVSPQAGSASRTLHKGSSPPACSTQSRRAPR